MSDLSLHSAPVNTELNLQEARNQSVTLRSRPVKAWLALTGRCNLHCAHCPRRSLPSVLPEAKDLPLEVFAKFEQEVLPFLGQCKVGGNNLGEQLLAEHWGELSSRIGRYPLAKILVTNGSLLTSEHIAALIKGNWTIDLSAEGATETTYRKVRGRDFTKFLSSVGQCCEQKRSLPGSGAKVRVCFTVFYDNLGDLEELVVIGAGLKIDEILVTHLIPMREQHRDQSLVYHKGLANLAFARAKAIAGELGISITLPPPFAITGINQSPPPALTDPRSNWSKRICYHPWTSVSINETGEVAPCCIFDRPMGNLFEKSFEAIWNGRRYQELRRSVNSTSPIGKCRNCPLRGDGFTSEICNDDRALLSVIGPSNYVDTGFFLRLKLKEALGRTQWGGRMFQVMRSAYRKALRMFRSP